MAHGAASAVIESGRHPLYKGGANLVDNFSEIFYKDVAEHIFVEEYSLSLGKTHTWSGYGMPDGFKAGCPTTDIFSSDIFLYFVGF